MEIIRQHKGLFLFESILFILLGAAAIAIPGLFTLSVELLIGSLLVIAGLVQLYRTFTLTGGAREVLSTLLSGILYLIVGALFLVNPKVGVLSLTMLLALLFLVQGLLQIYWGFASKRLKNWGWWVLSGLISLALAAIIWAGWPGTAVWVIGLLVGINLLFYGFSLLFITLEA